MLIETDNLLRVSTYAKQQNISPSGVKKRGKAGKVEIIKIDGVQFVGVDNAPLTEDTVIANGFKKTGSIYDYVGPHENGFCLCVLNGYFYVQYLNMAMGKPLKTLTDLRNAYDIWTGRSLI